MKKKILIIDDEKDILSAMQDILSKYDYDISTCSDPKKVKSIVESQGFDLIFLDIWMPEMDGYEVLQQIKNYDASIPIIIISGHANVSTSVEMLKKGAYDFIEKPFNSEYLLIKIRNLLKENIADFKEKKVNATPFYYTKQVKQRTIKKNVLLKGKGLHSGENTGIILSSAPSNTGILFEDISSNSVIKACLSNVADSNFYSTNLIKNGIFLKVVEHILSALQIYGITNVHIKCNKEIPIMDGCARNFCDMLEEAGFVEQEAEYPILKIKQEYKYQDPIHQDKWILIKPYDGLKISYTLKFPKKFSTQYYSVDLSENKEKKFYDEISNCQTFGFIEEAKEMQKSGLARGADLDNLLLLSSEEVVNKELNYENEFARHKVIDILGDLSLLRCKIEGEIIANQTGHRHNIALAKKISSF